MSPGERQKLMDLVADWRQRTDGLRARAIQEEDEIIKTDYLSKAIAYEFAALDLEALLRRL